MKKNIILAWVQSTIFVLQCLLRRSAKVLHWIKATNTSLSMLWEVLLLLTRYSRQIFAIYWLFLNVLLSNGQHITFVQTNTVNWTLWVRCGGISEPASCCHSIWHSSLLRQIKLDISRAFYTFYILHQYIVPSATFDMRANYTSCFTWFSFCCSHFHHWLSVLLHWTCEWRCRGNTPCNQPSQLVIIFTLD